jgi:hypothetical protein
VAIELLGERTIRIEELEADVQEMKAIFKAQLEEATRQLEALRKGPQQGGSGGGGQAAAAAAANGGGAGGGG